MKTDKKDTKIVISSRQWLMAGINDGSLILEETGIRINASAFSKDMPALVKKAQYAIPPWNPPRPTPFSVGEAAMYGLPGGVVSGMKGEGYDLMLGAPKQRGYTTSKLTDFVTRRSMPNSTKAAIEAVQGTPSIAAGPATSSGVLPIARTAPTAGVRMGLKQPFSTATAEYAAARGAGSGRVMSSLKSVVPGVKAIPGGLSTAGKGLAGAAASGGVRGFLAGNVISAAGSIAAWAAHKGLIAAYDWSRGANVISGAMRTPKGAQDLNKAQEILAQKVMPMMYGHAAGPNEKLVNLNSYIASMTKELESDPGYQAALSGQIPEAMATQALPEDLSAPAAGGGEFNPANQ